MWNYRPTIRIRHDVSQRSGVDLGEIKQAPRNSGLVQQLMPPPHMGHTPADLAYAQNLPHLCHLPANEAPLFK